MKPVLISVQHVSKFYKNKCVLRDVSFDVYEGELITLLGSNGAGKTTLSSIIATLRPADEGTLFWKGNSIMDCLSSYRMHVGYCQQRVLVHSYLTVEQNLTTTAGLFGMSGSEAEQAAQEVMALLSLEEYKHKYPSELSGGLLQRTLIARSLIHRPSLLILDEPTIALDPHVRRSLWNIIKDLKKQGVTIILTTHYLDEAEALSDRIVLMHQGRLISIVCPDEFKELYQATTFEDAFLNFFEGMQKERDA